MIRLYGDTSLSHIAQAQAFNMSSPMEQQLYSVIEHKMHVYELQSNQSSASEALYSCAESHMVSQEPVAEHVGQ